MISVLLIFLLFAVLQVAVLFYVRNIVAATSNMQPSAGGTRASQRIANSLSGQVGHDVPCAATVGVDAQSGLSTTIVHCEGSIKSIFLPFGAFVRIDVTARALTESPS
jgi:hypothetical protein